MSLADNVSKTRRVVIVNVVVVAPAAIVTLEGMLAARGLLFVREMVAPPAGAGPVKVTVPVALFPPRTDEGLIVKVARLAVTTGVMVSDAVLFTPL